MIVIVIIHQARAKAHARTHAQPDAHESPHRVILRPLERTHQRVESANFTQRVLDFGAQREVRNGARGIGGAGRLEVIRQIAVL